MRFLTWSRGHFDYEILLQKSDEGFEWTPGHHESGSETPSQYTDHMTFEYWVYSWLWFKLIYVRGYYSYSKFWKERNAR